MADVDVVVQTLAYVTILFGLIAATVMAANDAAAGTAGMFASLSTDARSAMLIGGFGFAVGLLLLDPGPSARILEQVLPLGGVPSPRLLLATLLAASFGTAAAVLLANWASLPVPLGLVFLTALAVAGAAAGARIGVGGTFAAMLGTVAALALAGVVSALALRAAIALVLRRHRPRDHLSPALPLAAALVFGLAGGAGCLALQFAEAARPPAFAAPVVGLALALIGFVGTRLVLSRDVLRFSNDAAGAEAAFRRLQLCGAAIACLLHGAAQTLLIALPVAAAYAIAGGARPAAWRDVSFAASATPILLLVLLGAAAVVLAGHRTAAFLGERLMPTGHVGGVAISLGTQAGALAALALGLPVAGNQAATGGVLGLVLSVGAPGSRVARPLLLLLAGWVLTPLVAAILALVALGLCRAWIG
jgi:phosphate/sulfate permease